jgi:DNA-binding transcriptional LysR family regulator
MGHHGSLPRGQTGHFFEVGGLNELQPVTCNDIDFCMQLAARGYRIVWTPWSLVEHRGLATRVPDHHSKSQQNQVSAELDRLRQDWGVAVLYDPWLNPNLKWADDGVHLRSPR